MIYIKAYATGHFHEGKIVETKTDPICGVYHKVITPAFNHPIFRLAKEIYGRDHTANQEAPLQEEDEINN